MCTLRFCSIVLAISILPRSQVVAALPPRSIQELRDEAEVEVVGSNDHAAFDDYTAAIRIDPNYSEALCNRGVIWRERGETEKALADYTAAIQADPQNKLALNNRAYAYRSKGDLERAIADYTAAEDSETNLESLSGSDYFECRRTRTRAIPSVL